MFNITEPARNRLSRKLAHKSSEAGVALRLTRMEDHWHLRTDTVRPEDTAFAHEGKNVLLLDGAASEAMTNMTLDIRETDAGPRLRLRKNPVQGG